MTEGCHGNRYLTEQYSLTKTCLSNLLSVALFVEKAPPSELSTALPLAGTPLGLLSLFVLPNVFAVLEAGSVALLPYFCPPTALALEW